MIAKKEKIKAHLSWNKLLWFEDDSYDVRFFRNDYNTFYDEFEVYLKVIHAEITHRALLYMVAEH